jgi:adenylyltransferase/sulfurtransferase
VPNCAEGGVLGVLPGIIGAAQAMETIKLILGVGSTLAGRLLIFDGLEMTWREVALRRNPDCPVCGDEPTQTELIDYEFFCGLTPEPGVDLASAVPEPDVIEASVEDVARLLEAEAPPFLLDVREPWEWAVGSLATHGARLIPLDELGERLGEIPPGRPIVVYCRTGQRSRSAARRLIEAGHVDVRSMSGGLVAWAGAVDPDLRVV